MGKTEKIEGRLHEGDSEPNMKELVLVYTCAPLWHLLETLRPCTQELCLFVQNLECKKHHKTPPDPGE